MVFTEVQAMTERDRYALHLFAWETWSRILHIWFAKQIPWTIFTIPTIFIAMWLLHASFCVCNWNCVRSLNCQKLFFCQPCRVCNDVKCVWSEECHCSICVPRLAVGSRSFSNAGCLTVTAWSVSLCSESSKNVEGENLLKPKSKSLFEPTAERICLGVLR